MGNGPTIIALAVVKAFELFITIIVSSMIAIHK
jgi:hypothetical protein